MAIWPPPLATKRGSRTAGRDAHLLEDCVGAAAISARSPGSSRMLTRARGQPGQRAGFVRHRELGIGRSDGLRTVYFFDSPATEEVVLAVEGSGVERTVLEPQQRAWWHTGERWMVGRVGSLASTEPEAYYVDFPNGRTESVLAPELRVRWAAPLSDPVALLACRAVETRFFHSRRSAFLRTAMAQRAGCEGIGGILSSAVELHQHQVGAARRVLLDPVPRYLLADEVGLGKTIEAGMVLRQLLADGADEALVLVPAPLAAQWKDELLSKFRINQYPGRVTVLSHDSLGQVVPRARSVLVVDEAHRLVDLARDSTDYEHLCALALAADALLLLSATPVHSNEDAFLRLLHLLDPANYRLEDLEAFRRKVSIRDDLAVSLSSLDDETPVAFLHEPAAQLHRLLPMDAALSQLLHALDAAIATDDTVRARTRARQIRLHISETYRIHRRVVRNRRTGSVARSFPVRGRAKADPWLLFDPDPRRKALLYEVESLRTALSGRGQHRWDRGSSDRGGSSYGAHSCPSRSCECPARRPAT